MQKTAQDGHQNSASGPSSPVESSGSRIDAGERSSNSMAPGEPSGRGPSGGRSDGGESSVSHWSRTHLVWILRLSYGAAALLFIGIMSVGMLPLLARVLIGFVLVRVVLLVAERLAEKAFIENVFAGDFTAAISAPGMAASRQAQVLRRLVSDLHNRALAEQAASYIAYCVDTDYREVAAVMRDFENTWGSPPVPGEDLGLVRRLLQGGFRFTTPVNPAPEPSASLQRGIPWGDLWRLKLWRQLRDQHPGEPLLRLLMRLYATEWQSLLAPVWVVAAIFTTVLLSTHWLSPFTRGILFYVMGVILGAAALWLAFILRPSAFNASLQAGDLDRCAHWVLESTEGKHFMVSALGSSHKDRRFQAVRLLLWHDALLTANLTLPEGMRAFARREGTHYRRKE